MNKKGKIVDSPTFFVFVNFDRLNSYPAPVRIILFLLTLLVIWLPIAAPMHLIWGASVGVALTILLYSEFLGLIWFWGRNIAKYAHPFRYYGLSFTLKNGRDFLLGLGLGCLTLTIFTCKSNLAGSQSKLWIGIPTHHQQHYRCRYIWLAIKKIIFCLPSNKKTHARNGLSSMW